MCALASSALGYEGITPTILSDQRGMNKNSISIASCKGIAEDEGVIQSECSLVIVAVQSASALRETLVCYEQATFLSIDILDDELVASVISLVNNSIAIARIAHPYAFPA